MKNQDSSNTGLQKTVSALCLLVAGNNRGEDVWGNQHILRRYIQRGEKLGRFADASAEGLTFKLCLEE